MTCKGVPIFCLNVGESSLDFKDVFQWGPTLIGKRPTSVILYIEKIHAILQSWNQSKLMFV